MFFIPVFSSKSKLMMRSVVRSILFLISMFLVSLPFSRSFLPHLITTKMFSLCRAGDAPSTSHISTSSTHLTGIFDGLFKGAFDNAEYAAPPEGVKASASHILVPSEDIAMDIKKRVEEGELTFAEAAGKFSTCNSKSMGGNLGSFPPGRMVPEFDEVIFKPSTGLNKILGPVTTKFGVHLIVIGKRSGV